LKKQKDKLLFLLLVVGIALLLNTHSVAVLAVVSGVFVMLSFHTALKALRSILFFNLSITIGVVMQSYFTHQDMTSYLVVFNLRVFAISFLTLFITSKINLLRVFSAFETIRFLLLATLSQIQSFSKTYEDFKLALQSRSVKKLSSKLQKEFISSMFYFFLKKSLHNSKERTLALKARGFFD